MDWNNHIMRKLVIFGVGQGTSILLNYFFPNSLKEIVAFCVDEEYLVEREYNDLPVLTIEQVKKHYTTKNIKFFLPMGYSHMNINRAKKFEEIKELGFEFENFVHSSSFQAKGAVIGQNVMILPGTVIGHDVKIKDNVVIWSASYIGDRTVIGENSWVSSCVCLNGDITIGRNCFFGSNSTVVNGVNIKDQTFVGPNALIAEDSKANSTYVGSITKPVGIDSLKFMAML